MTTLFDNVPGGVLISFNTSGTSTSFKIDYSMTRNTGSRTGTFWVASGQSNTVNSMDDYTENTNLGITLTVSQSGSTVEIIYSSTPTTGYNALMYYSITYFN